MNNALIILNQLMIMFLYIIIGYTMVRTKIIPKESTKGFSALLVKLVIPCVVLNAFCIERTNENTETFLWSLLAAAIVLGTAMLLAALLFRKNPIDNFGAAFSNAGFMGIPLVSAILGKEAVFATTAFIALLNVLQGTYGQALMAGNWKDCSMKKILSNPIFIGFVVGIIIFYIRIPIPSIVISCLSGISSMNAPLAMLTLGFLLAEENPLEIITDIKLYMVSLVRLILIPIVTVLILKFFPSGDMRLAILIVAIAPIGSNVAVYARQVGADYGYAAKTVCLSTILCIMTMPLVILLSSNIW